MGIPTLPTNLAKVLHQNGLTSYLTCKVFISWMLRINYCNKKTCPNRTGSDKSFYPLLSIAERGNWYATGIALSGAGFGDSGLDRGKRVVPIKVSSGLEAIAPLAGYLGLAGSGMMAPARTQRSTVAMF